MTTTGKILLYGQIECLSPLHIGCGSAERSDLDVLLDEQGNPFIPATSLIGVLQHTVPLYACFTELQYQEFSEKFPEVNELFATEIDGMTCFEVASISDEHKKAFKDMYKAIIKHARRIWGYTEGDEGQQSMIRCSDLNCSSQTPKPVIRDGIKIEGMTGMVKPTGKYDYELVERGTTFDLKMEFSYREDDATFVKNIAATIYDLLDKKQIRLGAKTNSGFGKIGLREGSAKIYLFDFSQKEDVVAWLRRKLPEKNCIAPDKLGTAFSREQNLFSMTAKFTLKNALIVRSYSTDVNAPDAVHITSSGKWVLPGTSLKGAIRARAERIVNTIFDISKSEEQDNAERIIKNLFGYVIENKKEHNKQKGRIRVEERLIENVTAEQHTRIKIDRFTGGTIESALLETMPVFSGNDDKQVEMKIEVEKCKPHEIGLLLLILKDLWTGDLAIGGEKNVGRGVLQGVEAQIEWHGKVIRLEKDLGKLTDQEKHILEGYVRALNSYPTSQQEDAHE